MCPYINRQYDSCKIWLGRYSDQANTADIMDAMRVKSYDLYDDFYFNRPESFSVTLRGNSDTEIYLPSTKKIVDATARFLAVDFDFELKGGDKTAVNTMLRNIFKREEIRKKFIKAKKSGLTRGDALWHIVADPNKKPGERISINTVHPGYYFPIEDINNTDRLLGIHLVDLVHDPRDKENDKTKKVARRLTYRKRNDGKTITTEGRLFEIGGWDDRNLKQALMRPISVLWPETELPPQITSLPIYHVPNNEPDGSTFGTSQVAGIEYVINGLNQSITYEDLTLILQGLGIYVTTAAPPIDQTTGKPTTYKMRPGNVIEMSQGDTFDRVSGVSSVSPYQEHMNFMDKYAMEGIGIPDMATGIIDVAVAQSGIALALKMGPIIAENQDKQLSIADKWDHIFYDLIHGWFPAYEGLESETEAETIFGDPMPINRDSVVTEVVQLYTAGLITIDDARKKLETIGYDYNSSITEKLLNETMQKSYAATGDIFGQEAGATSPELQDQLSSRVSSTTNGASNGA